MYANIHRYICIIIIFTAYTAYPIQCNPIQSNPIRFDPILCDRVCFDRKMSILWTIILCVSNPKHFVKFSKWSTNLRHPCESIRDAWQKSQEPNWLVENLLGNELCRSPKEQKSENEDEIELKAEARVALWSKAMQRACEYNKGRQEQKYVRLL